MDKLVRVRDSAYLWWSSDSLQPKRVVKSANRPTQMGHKGSLEQDSSEMGVGSHRPLSDCQPLRILSIILSIEGNRSDKNCRFCLIR